MTTRGDAPSHQDYGGRTKRGVVFGVALAAVVTSTSPSQACSLDWSRPSVQRSCGTRPEGSLVFAREAPSSDDDTTEWTEDATFSAILERSRRELRPYRDASSIDEEQLRAFRRVGPGNGVLEAPDPSNYVVGCTIELKGAAPPEPPPFGDVDVHVAYTEGGSSGGGCSCPEVDTLTIRPKVQLATRPAYVAAWFGADEDEATTRRDPDVLLAPNGRESGTEIGVVLGTSDEHERTGAGFGRDGRYCFSLAWVDTLGRIGERGPARCLDTTDTKDPAVAVDDEGYCLCNSVGTSRRWGSGGLTVALLASVVAVARRFMVRWRRD
jgi:hypothetical protein